MSAVQLLDRSVLYDSLPCGCVSYFSDGTIVEANAYCLNFLSKKTEDILFKQKFPNYLALGSRLFYQLVVFPKLMAEGKVSEINLDISVNGTTYPCVFNAHITDRFEDQFLITAILVQSPNRKKLENDLKRDKVILEERSQRLQKFAEILPHAIFTANKAGRINFASPMFLREFDLPEQILRQTLFLSLVNPEARRIVVKTWYDVVRSDGAFNMEIEMILKTGHRKWFLVRAIHFKNTLEGEDEWLGSCTDINEHKLAEKQREKMLTDNWESARQSVNEKQAKLHEISYTQAHVIRRPLANALAISELLIGDGLNTEHQILLGMLKTSINQLDKAVKSMIC